MKPSDIVESLRGHDAGTTFFVLGLEDGYALLADGKRRRVEKPKKKKLKHIRFAAESDARAAGKIRAGEKVTNNELRLALSEYRLAKEREKEGSYAEG